MRWISLLGPLVVLALVAAAPGAWHILDAANECSRNCQVGIDVMQYGLTQEALDNQTSSCIGCGICVAVCPMDTLSFGEATKETSAVPEAPAGRRSARSAPL